MIIKHWDYKELKKEKVAPNSVVLFYIGWSASANLTKPVFKKVAANFSKKVNFYSVEVSEPTDVKFDNYPIYFYPTFLFLKNSKIIESLSGTMSEDELAKNVKLIFNSNN